MFSHSKTLLMPVLCCILFFQQSYLIKAQDKELSFDQVFLFSEPRILKSLPRVQGWFDNDNYIIQKRDINNNGLIKVNANTGEESPLLNYNEINSYLDEAELSVEENIGITKDYTGLLFYDDDDLFFYSIENKTVKRLTNNTDAEINPTLSPDGKKVAFTRNKDLYVVNTETGTEIRLTNDASDVVYNGYASWVYMEEIIGRSLNYRAFWWAPHSEMIAFLKFDDTPVPKFPLVNYSSVNGSVEWEHYPKAGDPNPKVKMGVAHLNENKVIWIDEDEEADQYTAWPFWSPDSKQLIYQVLNRAQDELKVFSTNPKTGINKLIYEEKQPTWVEFFEDIFILKNDKGFIIRSDVDGWRHLYFYDMEGILKKKLTDGKWNVSKICMVDEENEKVYFEANKSGLLRTDLFVVGLDGTNLERLTDFEGTHSVTLSPGGKYFYDSYSNINTPAKLDLCDSEGNLTRNLGDRKSKIFDEYRLGKTELFMIKTTDGLELPAMWVLPPDFDEDKKYPVLFSVYGGPGGSDVQNTFSAFLDRYFISQSGIIYFVVDHRGSAYFGGKGKAFVHRNLGKWEVNDYSEAVKWLKEKPFIDAGKIAIVGGSYGGYVTCMALTLGSDYFNYGIAEYSLTDWKLYDNVYTERYMGTPNENPEGYKFSSALTYADKYKGLLRLVHSTLDDNVHLQNTLQLVERLTNMDKHFELMIYPNERHGVGFPKWMHSQRETVNFLFKNLLGKDFVNE